MRYPQVIQNTPIGDVKNLYYCSSLPIVREKLDYFLLQQEMLHVFGRRFKLYRSNVCLIHGSDPDHSRK